MPSSTRASASLVEWLVLAVGLFLTVQYAWILDDAYIYFRYVDNWLFAGNGLVYNRGEFVEGTSSPLWTLLLAALRATRLDYWLLVRLVAVASFATFWLGCVRVNRSLAPPGTPTVDFPLVFLGLNYAVLSYFSAGMESPLTHVAAVSFALLVLKPRSLPLQAVVALAPLVRHELALALAAAVVWIVWRERRIPWAMLAIAAATSGGYLAFRIWYYADLFPNTFYLKDVSRFGPGLAYVHDTFAPHHVYEVLLVAAALTVALRRRGGAWPVRSAERLVLLGTALAYGLYVVRIGGDARHYRYLAFPLCVAIFALAGIPEAALAAWLPPARRRIGAAVAATGIAALALTSVPRQLSGHPLRGGVEARVIDGIADAELHRRNRFMKQLPPWGSGREQDLLAAYDGVDAGDASVLVSMNCRFIYQHPGAYAIHSMGLTDAVLARADVEFARPTHKPDLIPLAREIGAVVEWHDGPPDRGMYRRAVRAGVAPAWVARNLETLDVIERKIYNRHDWRENLELAFAFPPPIDVGAERSRHGRD